MSKNVFRAGSAAVVVGAALLISPALASASSTGSLGSSDAPGATCTALSTEKTPGGWGIPFKDEAEQVAYYSANSVLDDDGSLELRVVDSTDRSVSYHSAGGIKLSDAIKKEIGFSERATHPTASFQLRLTGTSGNTRFPESGFTTLVWVAGDNADMSEGGVHADLQDGKWWSTSNIAGAQGKVAVPLADIAAANPNAVVDHYGVSIGTGSPATSTLVDAVKFNGCTTNFAKNDPESAGSLGSLGSSGSALFGSLNSSLAALFAGSAGLSKS